MEHRYDRKAEDFGNVVGLEHVNVLIPDQQARDAVLCERPRADARSLSDDQHEQHVDQRRAQPVPPADGRAAGAARPSRDRGAGPGGAARAGSRPCAKRSRARSFNVARAQFVRRGDLALGQPHPLPRAGGALRPDHARHALCRVRRRPGHAPTASRASTAICWRAGGERCGGRARRHASRPGRRPQELVFRETAGRAAPYDGHHIQIYIADFSGPHRRLLAQGAHQRGERSAPVPLQGHRRSRRAARCCSPSSTRCAACGIRSTPRPLVNRNPAQTNMRLCARPRRLDVVDGARRLSCQTATDATRERGA